MPDTEYEGAEEMSANSELRIITLELMRLASKSRRSFKDVAREYIENVYMLKSMLDGEKE